MENKVGFLVRCNSVAECNVGAVLDAILKSRITLAITLMRAVVEFHVQQHLHSPFYTHLAFSNIYDLELSDWYL